MAIRLRILPITMIAAFMLLGIKLGDLARGGEQLSQAFLVASVGAQEEPVAPSGPDDVKAPPATPAAAGKEGPAKDAPPEAGKEAPKEEGKEPPKEGAKPEAAAGDPEKITPPAAPEAKPLTTATAQGAEGARGLKPSDRYFSPVEIELLQNLAKRREELDRWEQNIDVKENLMANVEKRIDDKMVQMDGMKKELREMLATYTDQENAKIKSLVKIYENMKARDAARIFDEVEMPILLLVIDQMAEKKAAPILASMEPKKAKQLTVELAQQRKLHGTKLSAASAPGAAPSAPPPPAATPNAPPAAAAPATPSAPKP
jgi:flagellar motility protein MotE (MotC chaperone)